jgi:voltage-gated potassium channel Kch
MWRSALIWFFLLIATLSAIVEPAPIIILILCAASFFFWLAKLFSWAEYVREHPLQRTRLYIWFFMMFYSFIVYSFSLAYYAAGGLDYKIPDIWERIKALANSVYFSIVTATTLGYGDIVPSGFLKKCLSVLEVSFGVIFIMAILTVVLAFRDTSKESSR